MVTDVLLVAEDDADDALLLERALRRTKSNFRMVRVADGEEAINYVQGRGPYADRLLHPFPKVFLLDLKMPRKDGFAVLEWRKSKPDGHRLPVVVFSSSNLLADIDRAYSLGANSYVVKSISAEQREAMIFALHSWWAGFNATPSLCP